MRNVTLTLTERDAEVLRKRLEIWRTASDTNAEERRAFSQIDQQILYQTAEQTAGAGR